MQTKDGNATRNVVIVGGMSWNPAVRLVTAHGKTESYPGIERDFTKTFVTLNALPIDIFLGAHGVYFDMLGKLDRVAKEGAAVWIDPAGYHKAIAEKSEAFQKEVAAEKAGK
jgi:metallo-beta-lactamase class B